MDRKLYLALAIGITTTLNTGCNSDSSRLSEQTDSSATTTQSITKKGNRPTLGSAQDNEMVLNSQQIAYSSASYDKTIDSPTTSLLTSSTNQIQIDEANKIPPNVLSLQNLLNHLNVRTISSSLEPRLKGWCQSYLKDFFPADSVEFVSDETMQLRRGSENWTITILNSYTVRIKVKTDGIQYGSENEEKIHYNRDRQEWVGKRQYLPISPTCSDTAHASIKLQPTQDKHFVDYNRKFYPEHTAKLESQSYGEFDLSQALRNAEISNNATLLNTDSGGRALSYNTSAPVLDAPGGNPVGVLVIALKQGAYEGTIADIWLLDETNLPLADARVHYRAKSYPSLFVFANSAGRYFRLTPKSEQPLWISNIDLDRNLVNSFKSRGQIFEAASSLKIDSPHRVRSKPTLDSEVLASIVSSIGSITPLEVKGDWLKIHYIAKKKDGLFETVLNKNYGDNPINFDGWIKWRKAPGDEYVEPLYWVEGKQYRPFNR